MTLEMEYTPHEDRHLVMGKPTAFFQAMKAPVGMRHTRQQVANQVGDSRAVMDVLGKLRPSMAATGR